MKTHGKMLLDNGMKIYYSRRPLQALYANLKVMGGSYIEPSSRRGLAHLVEHVNFNGSKKFPSFHALCSSSEEIGLELDGSTSHLETNYPIKTSPRYFPRALEIIADLVFQPLHRPSAVRKEKKIILHELRDMQDTLEYEKASLFNEVFFQGTPAAEMVIGKEHDISRMSVRDVRTFHNVYYMPANAKFYLIGHIDRPLLKHITTILERYTSSPAPAPVCIQLPPLPSVQRVERFTSHTQQAYGDIVWRTPPITDHHQYVFPVIRAMLNGKGHSSLWMSLREKLKLVYKIGAYLFNDKHIGYFGIDFSCSPENIDTCIEESLRILHTFNPNDEELRHTKTRLENCMVQEEDEHSNAFQKFIQKEEFGVDYNSIRNKIIHAKKTDLLAAVHRYLHAPYQIMNLKPLRQQDKK